MNKGYTTRAQAVLQACLEEAQQNSNNVAEPEHLFKALLNDSSSILCKVLNPTERQEYRNIINAKINTFARQSNCPQPTPSPALGKIILEADKSSDGFVSVYKLAELLCDSSNIKALIKNTEDIKKRILAHRNNKKMDSRNADDLTDPMTTFAVDMVEQARQNLFDPVIGRDNEIRQIIEILSKKTKSNAILVGKPGVGKTAIVNGIAQMIANGEVPSLRDAKIYNVDIGSMVAGTSHRGDFEERLKKLIAEAESTPGTILFIDEIHIVLNAGKGEGALDAANMLKPGLAAGTIKCIGATTYDEYRKYVENDPAFERRFVQVTVNEPSISDAVTILRGLRERFELYYGAIISDKALVYAANASKKYIPGRRLPDIAIDLVDTACASAIISLECEPQEVMTLRKYIWSLELEKASLEIDYQQNKDPDVKKRIEDVVKKIEASHERVKPIEESYQREKAHIIESKKLKKKLEEVRIRLAKAERDRETYVALDLKNNVIPVIEAELKRLESVEVITPEHIAEVISRWTGIPAKRLQLRDNERLLEMGNRIKKRIFGQDQAVDAIVDAILQSRVGLSRDDKPIGAFLCLGPTGVGKTELAKAVAMELFDDEKNMVVLDMSDYSNEISITKLIGASAGYVGYNEGGALTEPVKNKPYSVVLLDEVDLAHPSVLNILYQLLDEGRVTDAKGTVVDFRNVVLIMTSNLGQHVIANVPAITDSEKGQIEQMVLAKFGPPLVNRIDSLICFNKLGKQDLNRILDYQLDELNKKLKDKNMLFRLSDRAVEDMLARANTAVYGARLLKRLIQSNFVHALTKILLNRKSDVPCVVECMVPEESEEGTIIGQYRYVVM